MRKILSLLIIPVLLIGCAKVKEAEVPQEQDGLHEVIFHAGWDPETRTVLQEDGSVWWSPGDEISLFVGSDNEGGYKLTSVETEVSPKADFRGEIPVVEGGKYVAVYPYDESTAFDKRSGRIILSLPERQIARENGFPEKAFKSLSVSTDDHLYFKNLFSGIKFSVAGDGIKEIEFSTPQDVFNPAKTGMSGWSQYDMDGACVVSGHSNRVTIVAPDNQGFVPGNYYYAVVCPGTYNSGLIVTYKKETTEATLTLDEEVTFKTSTFKRLYDKDAGLEFHKRAQKHATIPHFGSMLPNGVDKTTITEAHFYVSSDKTTETVLDSYPDYTSEPIYFELEGTIANYYTSAEVYKVLRAADLFAQWLSLKNLDLSTFDVSACVDFTGMFYGCLALEEIEFGDFNTSNAKNMQSMFEDCASLQSLDLSGFNTSNVQSMYCMFWGCRSLKELDLSNFDTHNVTNIGDMFRDCHHLEKLDLSSFNTDKVENAPDLFYKCMSLLKLNLGYIDLSHLVNSWSCYKLALRSRNCAVLCTPATKEALLSAQTMLGNCEPYIQWFCPGDVLPDLSMNFDPDMYYSTDYSQDKKVKMLNVASAGNGVDVVIMGEAYSDRLIADGTYEAEITSAMEQIFSIEPFKSFRHLFNVYMVYAVSESEVVGDFTAFGYYNDPWNDGLERDDFAINEYVSQAVGRSEDRDVTTMIVVNDYSSMGVTMVNQSLGVLDSDNYDYPAKLAGVAFGSKSADSERFRYIICHEFGHAFAALHDEYLKNEGEMETWESNFKEYYQEHVGWWANVSFTPDPSLVGWHRFLEDGSGYDETEVSIIEGALYSQGIWKSVDQSMMNAGGEFSVPAREAIYKKIHKVAYGEEWQYNFDDFVNWDRHAVPKPTSNSSPRPMVLKNNHLKPVFKIEESISADGNKMISVIMN